jgi:hypothetical protein
MEKQDYLDNKLFIRTKLYYTLMSADAGKAQLRPAVEFNLPYSGKVSLIISDINGRKVITLINNKYMEKGYYCRELDFSNLPGGEYYYKFDTDANNCVKKLQLIK